MKYVCTTGKSMSDKNIIKKLYELGMSTVRFNMSYDEKNMLDELVPIIKQINNENNYDIKLMMDLRGPEIRIDSNKHIEIQEGEQIIFGETLILKEGDISCLTKGDIVVFGDGEIRCVVNEINDNKYYCIALNSGVLKSNQKITNEKLCKTIPFLSEKDILDIEKACDLGINYLCVSFVNKVEDILQVKEIINRKKGYIRIIAKIETIEGVENLSEIIKYCDGIMIGRGDLGVRFPIYELAYQQKRISKIAKETGKKLIVGTGFLSSMKTNSIPTRAEVNDLYNTYLDGADEIMFSGETAISNNPEEVLIMANKIISNN